MLSRGTRGARVLSRVRVFRRSRGMWSGGSRGLAVFKQVWGVRRVLGETKVGWCLGTSSDGWYITTGNYKAGMQDTSVRSHHPLQAKHDPHESAFQARYAI